MIVDIRARGNKVYADTEYNEVFHFSSENVQLRSKGIGEVRIHCQIKTLDVRDNPIELVTVHGDGDVLVVLYSRLHPDYLKNVMSRVMKREDGMSLHSTQEVYPFFESGCLPEFTRAKIREAMDSIKGVTRKPRSSIWEGITIRSSADRKMLPICAWVCTEHDKKPGHYGNVCDSLDEELSPLVLVSTPCPGNNPFYPDLSEVNVPAGEDDILIPECSWVFAHNDSPVVSKCEELFIAVVDEIDRFLECTAPKRTNIGKEMRANVWKRHCGEKFKGNCYACRKDLDVLESWHCSHIVPHKHGGNATITNLVPCCSTCNLKNSSVDLHEWMYLEKNPNLDPNIKVMYKGIYIGIRFAKELTNLDCKKYFSPRIPLDMRIRLCDHIVSDGCT